MDILIRFTFLGEGLQRVDSSRRRECEERDDDMMKSFDSMQNAQILAENAPDNPAYPQEPAW